MVESAAAFVCHVSRALCGGTHRKRSCMMRVSALVNPSRVGVNTNVPVITVKLLCLFTWHYLSGAHTLSMQASPACLPVSGVCASLAKSHGVWTHSEGRPQRFGCLWCKACGPSSCAVQGCLQARYKICPDRHLVLGTCCANW